MAFCYKLVTQMMTMLASSWRLLSVQCYA